MAGSAAAFSAGAATDFSCFWSHASQTEAGVAIWLRTSWLRSLGVDPDTIHPLEPVPGRWMTIQLDTHLGRLDITSVYLHSGQRARERAEAIDSGLAAARNSMTTALWLAGDWNFAAETDGRWCLSAGKPTGDQDGPEQRTWETRARRHALMELYQSDHTHRTTSVTSRLDRIYTSCHLANKQDREFYAACGPWCPTASAHRPVFGGCRAPMKDGRPLTMRTDILEDPRWSYYTTLVYAHLPTPLLPSAFAKLPGPVKSLPGNGV
jgi:endonuclease/exonuclease/phosphatase family metal-dependent hydrolase